MRKQAEQTERRMQEFKHQMGENEKEVAAAKEIAKKAAEKKEKKHRKEAEKRAAAAKLLSDEERQRETKSLAVEAGLMGPPATTSVAGTRKPMAGVETGKSKGPKPAGALDVVVGSLARKQGAGFPTMVPHRGPSSIDLGTSWELGNVSGMCEELEDVSTLAEVLAGIPSQDVAQGTSGVAASASSTSVTSTRSEGGAGRRRKTQGSAVKRAIRPEEEEGGGRRGMGTSQRQGRCRWQEI